MSLIADIKKLRELEQKAKKDYVENGNWYRYNAEKLAPAMLSVLACFHDGDAETLGEILDVFQFDGEPMSWVYADCISRLQKAANLVEQEREG